MDQIGLRHRLYVDATYHRRIYVNTWQGLVNLSGMQARSVAVEALAGAVGQAAGASSMT
ncbi:hypothetical protein [Rhodococcus jostii]|uniref:hypothetical protein n=1 Tax=Rhodococcus jostii TaxID=132919 RepID=UPI00362BDB72